MADHKMEFKSCGPIVGTTGRYGHNSKSVGDNVKIKKFVEGAGIVFTKDTGMVKPIILGSKKE